MVLTMTTTEIEMVIENFLDLFLRDYPEINRHDAKKEIKKYSIQFVDAVFLNGKKVKAVLSRRNKSIQIDNHLSFNQKVATLIHEFIHIMDFAYGISNHKSAQKKSIKISIMDQLASNKTTIYYFRMRVYGII